MDFLKDVLGEELFKQFVEKINAHNGNEANKGKQIKIGNLGTGEYVGIGKYDALEKLLAGKQTELDEANGLITELKKGTKGNEELQGRISEYETQMANLQAQLQTVKAESAAKVGLIAAKALDVPYLLFKLNEKLKAEGRSLELDENDNVKGWDDLLTGLKTQCPAQFEADAQGGKIDAIPLPEGDKRTAEPATMADALRQHYEQK